MVLRMAAIATLCALCQASSVIPNSAALLPTTANARCQVVRTSMSTPSTTAPNTIDNDSTQGGYNVSTATTPA